MSDQKININEYLLILAVAEKDIGLIYDIVLEVFKWPASAKVPGNIMSFALRNAKKRQQIAYLIISRNLAPEMVSWLASSPTREEKIDRVHKFKFPID